MALMISVATLTLLTALGAVLALGTVTNTAVAAAHRDGAQVFYAAEAAVELAVRQLAAAPDWDDVMAGGSLPGFVDGPPAGVRRVGAVEIDLIAETLDVATMLGPAGGDGCCRLYTYGRLADLVPGGSSSPYYVAAWVTPLEADPFALRIVGRAYGPAGSRRSISLTVTRAGGDARDVAVTSWRELR